MIPDTRALPLPIQWHEGMLLAPQHFQQLSLRSEMLLQWRIMMASPYQWGVRRVVFDTVVLLNGRLRIRELEALMPDGLVISFSSASGHELEVDLTQHEEALRSGPLLIHLTVAAFRSGSSISNGDISRFDSVESEPMVDENTGEEGVRLPLLRPRLALFAGEQPPSRVVSMPLVEISLRGALYGVTDFIPPTLSVGLDSPLGAICLEVIGTLREKSLRLAEEIRVRHYDMGPARVQEQESKIQSMVEPLPYLEGLLNGGCAHPHQLYLALCLVAGHVATLCEARIPPVPPVYDHNAPLLTFMPLRDFILDAVEQGVWEEYMAITFHLRNDSFLRRIEVPWTRKPLLVGLRGAPRVSQREVTAWMEAALIGSSPLVQSLRERRILGAQRRPFTDTEVNIPARGLVLFEIIPDPEFVQPEQELVVLNLEEDSAIVEEIILFIHNEPRD